MEQRASAKGSNYLHIQGTNEKTESVYFCIAVSDVSMIVISSCSPDVVLDNILDFEKEEKTKTHITIYLQGDRVVILELALFANELRALSQIIQNYRDTSLTLHVQKWRVTKVRNI